MTLDELIVELTELKNKSRVTGDERVTISYFGGMGSSTVDVSSLGVGFDWTKGQIVINPSSGLTIYEWYRKAKGYV